MEDVNAIEYRTIFTYYVTVAQLVGPHLPVGDVLLHITKLF